VDPRLSTQHGLDYWIYLITIPHHIRVFDDILLLAFSDWTALLDVFRRKVYSGTDDMLL
jgi:hypothetical protein